MKQYNELVKFCQTFRDPMKGRLVGNNLRLQLCSHVTSSELTVALTHHETVILRFFADGSIMLNNGGHFSVTTKKNMNKYLPENVRVIQRKGQWYVQQNNTLTEYHNRMLIWPTVIEYLKAV